MDGSNWPLWIIAFSILLIAVALTSVLASLVMILRKIGAAADAVGFAVSRTGSLIRNRFSGKDVREDAPARGKGSILRGLSVVSAVTGALIRTIRRKKPRP